ncbi:MAG: diguanylate cyclase [Sulfuritalea sp.]|jgi:two-component system cell cycle response regulator|nr:diguanylate cyclase [Sulfuritalea sp.]
MSKALIVDPSRVVTSILSSLFARHGMEPCAIASGHEALKVVKTEPVEFMCFAYELGDMTGIDFFIRAKAEKILHNAPSVLFATSHDKDIVDRAIEAGVTECFSKYQMADFERFVEKFAAANRRRIAGSILLVEDSASMAMYCRQVLENMGLNVDVCESAEEAADRFARGNYDLVVADYKLAGTETALWLVRAVRGTAGRKSMTPILVMSGLDDITRKVEILRNGANDFVAKPPVAEELEVRVVNLLTMQSLVRQLEAQHEAMKDMAMRDQLTSLHNRHYLEGRLPELIREARYNKQPVTLVVVDVDNFKRVNDTHGHKVGDMVLEQLAQLLQRFVAAGEIMARVGGEEFLAVLPGVALVEAVARTEAWREGIETLCPGDMAVTASFGIAALAEGETYDQLFRRADDAVYRAKSGGRNRVETEQST